MVDAFAVLSRYVPLEVGETSDIFATLKAVEVRLLLLLVALVRQFPTVPW